LGDPNAAEEALERILWGAGQLGKRP